VEAIPRDLAQAVRSGNLFSSRGSSVLDAPELDRAQKNGGVQGLKRRAPVTEMPLRRDRSYLESFASGYGEEMAEVFPPASKRRPGLRLSLKGALIPRTVWGRVAAGGALMLILGAIAGGTMWARSFLLSDEHFVIPSSAAIQIAGNSHLTNAQLLSVFGGDVDRNIFRVPLDQRRAELESLPWVAHATVMRLLPNRIRVGIVERTPVAFVRNGTKIGLVDRNGVLFDVPDPQPESGLAPPHYSFPVLTGISPDDPLSTRSARVRLYLEFMESLDTGGEGISKQVSEVDLSYPDDVKAIVADSSSHTNLLVHFGSNKYLERYHQYQQHLAEWKTQCPRLASVDMRYEQQVVLEPCTAAPEAATATVETPAAVIPALHGINKAKPLPRHKPPLKVTGKAKRAAHGAAR